MSELTCMMRPMMIASILKRKKNIELASQMGPNTQQFLQRSRLGEISAEIVGRFFGFITDFRRLDKKYSARSRYNIVVYYVKPMSELTCMVRPMIIILILKKKLGSILWVPAPQ